MTSNPLDTRPIAAMLRALSDPDEEPNAGLVSRFYKCLAASADAVSYTHLRAHET